MFIRESYAPFKEIKALPIPGAYRSSRAAWSAHVIPNFRFEIAALYFPLLTKLEKQMRAAIDKSGIKESKKLKSDLITNKPEIIIDVDKSKAQREGNIICTNSDGALFLLSGTNFIFK
jgi:hypothetical protein